MGKKKELVKEIIENINPSPLDSLMGECYSVYAKDVIKDRAIPDVRDGLKPVQRRIIFDMYKNGMFFERPTVKCAHIVGDVMGKLHPHGDSSIYEAIVRMSQDWKVNAALISFQGNNGSIDGDGPAAYRYTEARLSELAFSMVEDIDKNTVDMALNFDDTELEPIVLPARFPNLYVNGTQGIAVALATDIPPHNLREMCDATIFRIQNPKCSLDDLLNIVQGPDFPTGGIIYRSEGLRTMYENGRGRIEICSKWDIVEDKNGTHVIISEIPYGVFKKDIVYAIDLIRQSGAIDGINEVRDETEMFGVRIVLDIKEGCDANLILQYLVKHTPLQSPYNANMVAIVDGRPKTLSLIDYLDSYIVFQQEVIRRRSNFILEKDKDRVHILDGLVKAVSIIDQVVACIKASKNKADSKTNLMNKFGFTEPQAEAIVTLQLYRLSNTDITKLLEEKSDLEEEIKKLNDILTSSKKLNSVIVGYLKSISSSYSVDRKSIIVDKPEEVTIDKRDLIANEEVMIAVSRDGYLKRSSMKSYKSSFTEIPGLKIGDCLIASDVANTVDYLLCFTNKGNYCFLPIHEIQDGKWKDEGKHINYICQVPFDELIIKAIIVEDFNPNAYIVSISAKGRIKRSSLADFYAQRYSKPICMMRLGREDYLADVVLTNGNKNLLLIASDGKSSYYNENELVPMGLKTSGVKAMNGIKDNKIIKMLAFDNDEKCKLAIITNKLHERIFDISNLDLTERLGRNYIIMKSFKSDPHEIKLINKINKESDFMLIYALDTLKELIEIKIDDYHVTPIEKYAKYNMDNVPADKIINEEYCFQCDHAKKDMKTFKIPPKGGNNQADEGEKEEKKPEFEQISMFDLNGD